MVAVLHRALDEVLENFLSSQMWLLTTLWFTHARQTAELVCTHSQLPGKAFSGSSPPWGVGFVEIHDRTTARTVLYRSDPMARPFCFLGEKKRWLNSHVANVRVFEDFRPYGVLIFPLPIVSFPASTFRGSEGINTPKGQSCGSSGVCGFAGHAAVPYFRMVETHRRWWNYIRHMLRPVAKLFNL